MPNAKATARSHAMYIFKQRGRKGTIGPMAWKPSDFSVWAWYAS